MIIVRRLFQTQVKYLQSRLSSTCVENTYKYSYNFNCKCFFSLIMASNRYCIDLAKRGVASCKECKKKIDKGVVRIAKILPNPFTDSGGEMKQWFHVRCIFMKLSRARATTKKIDCTDDLEGWDDIEDENKAEVLKCLSEFSSNASTKKAPPKKAQKKGQKASAQEEENDDEEEFDDSEEKAPPTKDDSFRQFRKICTELTNNPKYTDKTAILSDFFSKGSDGDHFEGDLYLWVKMLLPAVEKRVYNLQTAQLIKIFSKIFRCPHEEMLEELEQGEFAGDVSEVIKTFFEKSRSCPPAAKSILYLQDVDKCLEDLTKNGQEVEQMNVLSKVSKKCTGNDLKYFVRLIKHDLRINAGPKHILEAIHPTAYQAFQASRDLKGIVKRCMKLGKKGNINDKLAVKSSLMTPVLPMLAMACKDLQTPFIKCPNGLYIEVKYDGERVQLHKRGNEFSYFSRSLKPVMAHKVSHLKDFIPKAFPHGNDLMLDCEILLVDNEGKPLPFGTLGAHRKNEFKDATVCLFVFDCLQFNDENLMNVPLVKRREILEENMKPIKNHVMFSELKEIKTKKDLKDIVESVFDQGLEGIVIKAKDSIYEPGKRHWLKLKKDYLKNDEGEGMADSADLVVLGGYYGTGRKGGIMSVFLMGCYNEKTGKWCTVTKVPGGDDSTLDKLQKNLKMKKISKDPNEVPSWLNINRGVIPDFVCVDPKDSPVWEISGAEFSKSESHTASGISIRFPRVTRVRDDKTWETATTLRELKDLYKVSKTKSEVIGLKTAKNKSEDDDDNDNDSDSGMDTAKNSGGSSTSSPVMSPKMKHRTLDSSKKIKRESSPSVSNKSSKTKVDSPGKRKSKSDDDNTFPKKVKSETQSKPSGSSSSVLPNVFTGIKLYIPPSVEKADVLRRYFVAYDGDLLTNENDDEASHVIVDSENSVPLNKSKEKITTDWLWDCIKLQKIFPTKLYHSKS